MPELPEVETIIQNMRPAVAGKTIRDSRLLWERTLAHPTPKEFKRRVQGKKITSLTRRGKFIHLHLDQQHLLFHLRMSGDLMIKPDQAAIEKHDRLILMLSDGIRLVFHDPRKFGRVWLVVNPEEVLGNLGPEPLDTAFTAQAFYTRLHARKRPLKPLLLDQTFIAGLGNIYTDEALHLARLHPLRRADSISTEQAGNLWQAVRDVLQEGIRRNGASIDWVYRGGEFQNHFRVYGRTGQPCLVCDTPIERLVIGQRGTHICPTCQTIED